MKVSEILALVPDVLLDELAVETRVNRYSKKLQGQVMFKLLLYCILSYKDNSLRMMECAYESAGFKLLNAQLPEGNIHYSSLSERLNAMDASYFEKLYQACLAIYSEGNSLATGLESVTRFDSTIVSLSSALLKTGYHLRGGDADHVRQLKFTVELDELPRSAHLFTEQTHSSEDVTLRQAMLDSLQNSKEKKGSILIFDRGVSRRKTYDELTDSGARFISRLGKQNKQEEQKPNVLAEPLQTATLTILSDSWAYLFAMGGKRTKHAVRCIRAVKKKDGEPLLFVTNIDDLPADMITDLYKRRWDIEVFFKFLKQELNFSHLISRTQNGIKVMLYATMIASVLLLIYKKTNKLKGYKIMKHKFLNELEMTLLKDFVVLCGGNPDLVYQLLKIPPL